MSFVKSSMLTAGALAMVALSPIPVSAANMTPTAKASSAADILSQANDGHRRRWRHRDRVDTGDVLAGIGILAGIAIIAGAASEADKRDREEPRYEERREDRPVYQGNDLGTAVSACTDAAERSAGNAERVREIRSVTRDGEGWRVEGDLSKDAFSCAATGGRVDYIRIENREI